MGAAATPVPSHPQTQQDWLQRILGKATGIGAPSPMERTMPTEGEILRYRPKPNVREATNDLIHDPTGLMMAGAAGPGRVLTNGMYSRLDEAAQMLPKKGVPASGVMNWLKKSPEGISPEEVAYRKLSEFLSSQGNQTVTPEMLASHLKANPAPFPKVKTLQAHKDTIVDWLERNGQGVPQTPDEWTKLSAQMERTAQGWQQKGDTETANRWFGFAEDAGRHAEGVSTTTGSTAGQPKFSQYQVPGGENYRETLQTLPGKPLPMDEWAKQYRDFDPSVTPEQLQKAYAKYQAGDSGITVRNAAEFRSSHFPDDPNLLVHTRSNDRTLPSGEPGRFVEEVQSDWHQKGVKDGYQTPELDRLTSEYRALREQPGGFPDQNPEAMALRDRLRSAGGGQGVPDAPFKETWPDLGLKQQLIETANDPKAEWLGFTGGKTQADRYDLSKHIEKLRVSRLHGDSGTRYYVSAQQHGDLPQVEMGSHSAEDLAGVIGKEMAERIINNPKQAQIYTGLDLQVGGEGMHAFYDQKLPKRLEKIVKPFGGTVEAGEIAGKRGANEYGMPDRHLTPEPMWFSRLTPEMKAAIKRGVPLMSVLGATGLHQLALQMKMGSHDTQK